LVEHCCQRGESVIERCQRKNFQANAPPQIAEAQALSRKIHERIEANKKKAEAKKKK